MVCVVCQARPGQDRQCICRAEPLDIIASLKLILLYVFKYMESNLVENVCKLILQMRWNGVSRLNGRQRWMRVCLVRDGWVGFTHVFRCCG